ncbi:hypothetical protein EB061_12100, partial [bacterium]|nr:hypothetical protein [bacterium]
MLRGWFLFLFFWAGTALAEVEVESTYGVMTEEETSMKWFASPWAGFGASTGVHGFEVSPDFAAGGEFGALISDRFYLGLMFTRASEQL